MYITLQTDYAIRIVDYLAETNDLKCSKEIAEETSIPLRFAKNILQTLTGGEIVVSYKGINGGYKIARSPEKISLYDVFRVMDESVVMSRCLKADYECTCSPDKQQCIYYSVFMQISGEIENQLRAARFSAGTCRKY